MALSSGLIPAHTDATPAAIVKWAARTLLHAALRRGLGRVHRLCVGYVGLGARDVSEYFAEGGGG